MCTVSLQDVKDISDPLKKVEAGLQAAGGDVPLQSVHIRAKLIDLAAKVGCCMMVLPFINHTHLQTIPTSKPLLPLSNSHLYATPTSRPLLPPCHSHLHATPTSMPLPLPATPNSTLYVPLAFITLRYKRYFWVLQVTKAEHEHMIWSVERLGLK